VPFPSLMETSRVAPQTTSSERELAGLVGGTSDRLMDAAVEAIDRGKQVAQKAASGAVYTAKGIGPRAGRGVDLVSAGQHLGAVARRCLTSDHRAGACRTGGTHSDFEPYLAPFVSSLVDP
jgi:hypothetical protein